MLDATLRHHTRLPAGPRYSNGLVNSSDISDVQAQSGQPFTASNFKEDVT
jgi:hypothetical protein